MKIRHAWQTDLQKIVEIEQLCFPAETAFPPGMFSYLIRYACTIVASEDDWILGFIIGYASGRTGFIYTLDVHPQHRKKGIGKRLMEALELELHASGARKIRLEAAIENPAALELYRKAGYKDAVLIENYYGQGKSAIRMVKGLGPHLHNPETVKKQ
jgi:[ribosomal protein S18]-alanine N-acetyltransferase